MSRKKNKSVKDQNRSSRRQASKKSTRRYIDRLLEQALIEG